MIRYFLIYSCLQWRNESLRIKIQLQKLTRKCVLRKANLLITIFNKTKWLISSFEIWYDICSFNNLCILCFLHINFSCEPQLRLIFFLSCSNEGRVSGFTCLRFICVIKQNDRISINQNNKYVIVHMIICYEWNWPVDRTNSLILMIYL